MRSLGRFLPVLEPYQAIRSPPLGVSIPQNSFDCCAVYVLFTQDQIPQTPAYLLRCAREGA